MHGCLSVPGFQGDCAKIKAHKGVKRGGLRGGLGPTEALPSTEGEKSRSAPDPCAYMRVPTFFFKKSVVTDVGEQLPMCEKSQNSGILSSRPRWGLSSRALLRRGRSRPPAS